MGVPVSSQASSALKAQRFGQSWSLRGKVQDPKLWSPSRVSRYKDRCCFDFSIFPYSPQFLEDYVEGFIESEKPETKHLTYSFQVSLEARKRREMRKLLKCEASESKSKRPKAAERSFNKEILLLGEMAFCPLFYYWSEDRQKI